MEEKKIQQNWGYNFWLVWWNSPDLSKVIDSRDGGDGYNEINENNVDEIYDYFMDTIKASKNEDNTTNSELFAKNIFKDENLRVKIKNLLDIFGKITTDELKWCWEKQSSESIRSYPRLDESVISDNIWSFAPTGGDAFLGIARDTVYGWSKNNYDLTLTERVLAYAVYYVKNKWSLNSN